MAVGCEPQLAKVPSVMGEYDPVLVGGVLAVAGADVIDSHAVLLLTPTQYEKPTLKPKVQLTFTDGFHSKKLSAVIPNRFSTDTLVSPLTSSYRLHWHEMPGKVGLAGVGPAVVATEMDDEEDFLVVVVADLDLDDDEDDTPTQYASPT